RPSVRVHTAALRVLPRAAVLDLRPPLGRRRPGADRGRRRHGPARLRDRPSRRVELGRRRRRRPHDGAPVPDLARRPPQPRDPRPVPRRGDRARDAPADRAADLRLRRALWKANNVNTYDTLTHGGWIDDVPPYPGAPPTPQDAYERYLATGKYTPVDECAQMDFFSHKVHAFWLHHFGEKAKLALLAGQ